MSTLNFSRGTRGGATEKRLSRTSLGRCLLALAGAAALSVVGLVSPEAQAQVGVQASVSAGAYADTDPSALTDFKEPLGFYGAWADDPTYGTVWVPNKFVVGTDFVPYQTSGHWALTPGGEWMWVSSFSWGHIPFHYGRWVAAPGRGWVWIPGRKYSPAWVTWRVGAPGHIGWAPAVPTFTWRAGHTVTLASAPAASFVFVPSKHAFRADLASYTVRDKPTLGRLTVASHAWAPVVAAPGVHVRASPTLVDAHVSAAFAPRVRVAEDRRAIALSTRAVARPAAVAVHVRPASPAVRPHVKVGVAVPRPSVAAHARVGVAVPRPSVAAHARVGVAVPRPSVAAHAKASAGAHVRVNAGAVGGSFAKPAPRKHVGAPAHPHGH